MSLRIGTFNTQLRSYAMEALARLDPAPNTAPNTRAEIIANRILKSGYDYDVIALNEVFDEGARAVLVARLQAHFPFRIEKVDASSSLVAPGAAAVPVGLYSPVTGVIMAANAFATGKLEDSGLMLFSRLPFADVPKHPGVPALAVIFSDADGADQFAAKGAAYVRCVDPVSKTAYNIVFTHLQADNEHAGTREAQLKQIEQLIAAAMQPTQIAQENIFVMGDFNIDGNFQNSQGLLKEWNDLFDPIDNQLLANKFSIRLADSWAADQPRTDPGVTHIDKDGPRRFDYILRAPTASVWVQHLTVAYNLMDPNTPYTSDHYGLNADLNPYSPHCHPKDPLLGSTPDYEDSNVLLPGAMKWYLFQKKGTYSFRLESKDDRLGFAVYSRDNLSIPVSPYREETTRYKEQDYTKYVLDQGPFYVRVFHRKRGDEEVFYTFKSHRHQGASREDFIQLLPHDPQTYEMPKNTKLNLDDPVTMADDIDTVWFGADIEATTTPSDQTHLFTVRCLQNPAPGAGMSLIVVREAAVSAVPEILTAPAKENQRSLTTRKPGRFFVQVKRTDPAFSPPGQPTFSIFSFNVLWENRMTILHGKSLSGRDLALYCVDETNPEVGSDDIMLRIYVDGAKWKDITNGDIGDFDDGDYRILDHLIAPIVFTKHITIQVVEGDDFSADDIGRIEITPLANGIAFSMNDHFDAQFDSGHYQFWASRKRWSPTKLT